MENTRLLATTLKPEKTKKDHGIRVALAQRWAMRARQRITSYLRPIFDVEADPRFKSEPIKEKVKFANLISKANHNGPVTERHKITVADYEKVVNQINSSKALVRAVLDR